MPAGGLDERAVAVGSKLGSGYLFPGTEAILCAAAVCDATAAKMGHSLTAGCTSNSRAGRC